MSREFQKYYNFFAIVKREWSEHDVPRPQVILFLKLKLSLRARAIGPAFSFSVPRTKPNPLAPYHQFTFYNACFCARGSHTAFGGILRCAVLFSNHRSAEERLVLFYHAQRVAKRRESVRKQLSVVFPRA